MAFSETCAVKFIPFVIRIVLCAVFLPMGWHKIFNTTEFSTAEADQLFSIGVSTEGLDWQRIQTTGIGSKAPSTSTVTNPASPGKTPPRSARTLYKFSLMADNAGFPYPAIAGWLVGLTELGGSVLLLIGAFSRIFALGIACVMAGAFWMTNWAALMDSGWWVISETIRMQICAHVALFLLAINVMLVGPGFLSIDGMMHASPRKSKASPAGGDKSSRKEPK